MELSIFGAWYAKIAREHLAKTRRSDHDQTTWMHQYKPDEM